MVRRRRTIYANLCEPIGDDQLANVIRGYWRKIVERFGAKGFREPASATRISIRPSWHDTCRHYAGAREDGRVIVVAPQIADLPDAQIVAILAHEGGHLVDFAQPGRFFFRPAREMIVRAGARAESVEDIDPEFEDAALFRFETFPPSKGMGKHLTEWRERPSDEVERVADAIASFVMGDKIGYTGKSTCLIQTMGRGVERPIGLR